MAYGIDIHRQEHGRLMIVSLLVLFQIDHFSMPLYRREHEIQESFHAYQIKVVRLGKIIFFVFQLTEFQR